MVMQEKIMCKDGSKNLNGDEKASRKKCGQERFNVSKLNRNGGDHASDYTASWLRNQEDSSGVNAL